MEYNEEWVSENKRELINDFVEENRIEFDEYIEQERATLEQEDMDYWKLLFCEEQNADDFSEFCEYEFNDYMDILETENSYRR